MNKSDYPLHNQHKILRVLQLISLLKAKPAKSMIYLAGVLGCTERTVYRYLDLLTEVGFQVERDGEHQAFIDGRGEEEPLEFTEEEAALMKRLLLSTGRKSHLRDAIMKKLIVHSEVQVAGEHLAKTHIGKMVEQLATAMQNRRQVILKRYHSVNSNGAGDRRVEPICFTENYQTLVAFEIASGKNKYFKVEWVGSIETTDRKFKFTDKHKYEVPDVFGISPSGKKYRIELLLPLQVGIQLREEFPMTASLLHFDQQLRQFHFLTSVNDLKPITHFLMKFLDDVVIIGSEELRLFLKEHIQKVLEGSTFGGLGRKKSRSREKMTVAEGIMRKRKRE